jgi:cytochrome c biogenesis protein CcmG/thiol:disulfide interchange protein DsbE
VVRLLPPGTPVLVEFSKKVDIPLIGLNYKEVRGDGGFDMSKMPADEEKKLAWQRANHLAGAARQPLHLTVMDLDGRVGIDYGVYGVPETYVIDKAGVIRMKHTGPISPEILAKKIMPLLAELNK